MPNNILPLRELSIKDLCGGQNANAFVVPVYQRNYAWGKEEITALVQDVYDAFTKPDAEKTVYYIGTLVTFNQGDCVFEVIDGQQRLTTITLILKVLGSTFVPYLTYKARKKADDTIKHLPNTDSIETDRGIINGYRFAEEAVREIVGEKVTEFTTYFLEKVKIIHYEVPKDIDLNHYFEIMNSRGEQLEKHEIVKARLISELEAKGQFNYIWECCAEMGVYIQDRYRAEGQFTDELKKPLDSLKSADGGKARKTIGDLLEDVDVRIPEGEKVTLDSFQPIIDFPNFLLIVLKITRLLAEEEFKPTEFNLDDKELIKEFNQVPYDVYGGKAGFAETFSRNLLKAKYYLDNFVVHHSNEEDTLENNPWKLQHWNEIAPKSRLESLCKDIDVQLKLMHLLSMFEVSFVPRQRKNYLFYCLLFLFNRDARQEEGLLAEYADFVEALADKYFYDIYLDEDKLSVIKVPLPRSFDDTILSDKRLTVACINDSATGFNAIYGDGSEMKNGSPALFVFNYIDYRIWKYYAENMRGEKLKENSPERRDFFTVLGCSDFGLDVFKQFYFSRTRRSLEHYFPQAMVVRFNENITEAQINCLGNFAMIGSAANTAGSDFSPIGKLQYYGEVGKNLQISVASLKFIIMMQICKDNHKKTGSEPNKEWFWNDIKTHQARILNLLDGKEKKDVAPTV